MRICHSEMNVYVHGQNGRFHDVKISPFLDFGQEKHFKKDYTTCKQRKFLLNLKA